MLWSTRPPIRSAARRVDWRRRRRGSVWTSASCLSPLEGTEPKPPEWAGWSSTRPFCESVAEAAFWCRSMDLELCLRGRPAEGSDCPFVHRAQPSRLTRNRRKSSQIDSALDCFDPRHFVSTGFFCLDWPGQPTAAGWGARGGRIRRFGYSEWCSMSHWTSIRRRTGRGCGRKSEAANAVGLLLPNDARVRVRIGAEGSQE